jgi:hypothetical protein
MTTFREEDMYPYVKRNLRSKYPVYDGWEIYEKDRWIGYEPDFVVERKCHGKIQRVVAEVKAICKVPHSYIAQLNKYVRNLSGKNIEIVGKILVIPAGADTSGVPYDVKIMYLRSFNCEGKDIVWYK